MKKQNIYFLIIVVIFIFTSCKQLGTIEGVVIDAKTDESLENVEIEILPAEMANQFTNSSGAFTFADLPEGWYKITAKKENYETISKEITITADDIALVEFSLNPNEILFPNVTTDTPIINSQTSVTVIGNITYFGGSAIIAHGHVWSTSPVPTTSLTTKVDYAQKTTLGNYTSNITNLRANTTYYLRAFATNNEGTAYSNEISFVTAEQNTLPTISTKIVSEITSTSAQSGGNITDEGSASITSKGVCWNTAGTPIISDNNTEEGVGTDLFISNLNNLSPNTTYYIRAYATNDLGTAYGDEQSFTTLDIEKKVLIINFTGHKCINSPYAQEVIDDLQSVNGNKIVQLAIHCGSFSIPDTPNYPSDFRTETGDDFYYEFMISIFPSGFINSLNSNELLTTSSWTDEVNNSINKEPEVKIEISNNYNINTNDLTVSVTSEALNDINNDLKLVVYLVEDSIVAPQMGEEGYIEDYIHRNVLRTNISDTWGSNIFSSTITTGDIDEKSFEITLQNEWIAEKCKVIAFIYNYNTKEILNSESEYIIKN